MFTHIVFFNLNEPTKENVEWLKNLLLSMEGNIPQLRHIEVGIDVVHSERSYDLALVTKFDSQEAANEYNTHPYHVNEVVKKLAGKVKSTASVDYNG